MKKWHKIAICIVICVSFFAMSLSVFAVDPPPSSTPEPDDGLGKITESMISYYVWLTLRAWGIKITYNELLEFNDYIEQNILDWVIEYLASLPSNYSINQWIAPWQVNYDYWGNLQENDSMLEDIQDFADWLIAKFNLVDNQNIPVNPVTQVGSIVVYKAPINLVYTTTNQDQVDWEYIQITSNDDVYIGFYEKVINGVSNIYINTFKNTAGTVQFQRYKNGSYNTTLNPSYGLRIDPRNNDSVYWYWSTLDSFVEWNGSEGVTFLSYNLYSEDDYWNAMKSSNSVTQIGDVYILTEQIITPDLNPSYSNGDSITIIDDNPSYSQIDWSSEITVSNLPAIVSTGKIPTPGDENNPGLVSAWRPISSLITVAGDSMAVILGIIYEFPEEVVVPIFAVMGGIIIFGVIHALKEH